MGEGRPLSRPWPFQSLRVFASSSFFSMGLEMFCDRLFKARNAVQKRSFLAVVRSLFEHHFLENKNLPYSMKFKKSKFHLLPVLRRD